MSSGLEDSVMLVLQYFLNHPGAVDSVEGISAWRGLPGERTVLTVELTELAVRKLVAEGFLREVPADGSAPRYRLEETRREDAARVARSRGR